MQNWFLRRNDLGFQILALYILFVAPVVVAAFLFDSVASRRMKAEAQASDLTLARAIAEETNTTLFNALQAVQELAGYPAVFETDPAGMQVLFKIVLATRPDTNLIYRLDSAGIMVFHYPESPGTTVGTDFSYREYFQQAQKTSVPFISKGRISPTTGQPVATAVMPLWNESSEFIGLVATNIKLESLSIALKNIAAEYPPTQQLDVLIIDATGQVIAHAEPRKLLSDLSTYLPEIVTATLQGVSGNREMMNPEGTPTLYSFVPVSNLNWGVIVSRPLASAYATPRTLHRAILLATAIFLAIGLLFWFALSNRVIQPLERLASLSQIIGLQEFHPEQREILQSLSRRPDQMGKLINNLTRMEAAIQARLAELSTLLETSAAVVSSLDTDTVLNRILEQVERLLGIKQSIIVAFDQKRGIFRARASRGMSERYARSLEISPDEVSSVTMRAIRLGEPIQVRDTETDPSFTVLRPRARAEGYRSMAAIPLKTTHATPSALNVYSPKAQVFNEHELDLLSTFANQAAMAIENAELYARSDTRLQEQTRRLEALIQSLEVGLILEDLQGRVLYTNRMVSELSGMPIDEVIGYPVENLCLRLSDRAVNIDDARAKMGALLSGTAINQEAFTLPMVYPGGSRYIRMKGFTVSDARGVEIGRGQILQDITREYEIDRMKTSLISTVSHELRTPLASIKGYATTLLAEDIDWEMQSQREFLTIISRDTDRLSDMVDNLLDMSRIETGSLTLSKTACALENIIIEGVQRVEGSTSRTIQIDTPPDLPPVYVDAYRIEVVIRNLVENAIKYSEEDQPIHIHAFKNEQQVIVRIQDQGPGIPPEKVDAIFDSFYRLDNGLTRRNPGVGLGLAICRGFVNAHGGEIWVEPRPVGACLAFSIPLINTEILAELFHE